MAFVMLAGFAEVSPASAERIQFVCSLNATRQASMRQLGENPDVEWFINIDTDAGTATDWATYPGDTDPLVKLTTTAKVTAAQITWSTPPDPDDGTFATRIFDRNSKVLNAVDPEGDSVLWNCQ